MEKELYNLPADFGNRNIGRIFSVYRMMWWQTYGMLPEEINWGMIGRLFKPLFEKYTEYHVAALVILHFDWKGTTGEDQWTHNRLLDKCFPLEWVPKNVNAYKVYLTNVLGYDWNDPEAMKAFVVKSIKEVHPQYLDYLETLKA